MKNKINEIRLKEGNKLFLRSKSEIHNYKKDIECMYDIDFYKKLSFIEKIKFIDNDYIELLLPNDNIKNTIKKHLLNNEGKINSPILKNKFIKIYLNFLDKKFPQFENCQTISQKIYFILNDYVNIPLCPKCNNLVYKTNENKRFCCQKCAVTSIEHVERVSKQFLGKKLSESRKKEMSEITKETWKDDNIRNKRIKALKISNLNNGVNFLDENNKPWNYGLNLSTSEILKSNSEKLKGKPGLKGENNPMFGKSPSLMCGRGIKGSFKGVHFRSSLELLFLIQNRDKEIKTAETKLYNIEYYDENRVKHTYHPDFVIDGVIYEIKPKKFINDEIVQLKFSALKEKFDNSILITEEDIEIIMFSDIEKYIKKGELILTDNNLKRLKRNIK